MSVGEERGAVYLGNDTILHPAIRTGSVIQVLCSCRAASPQVGRLLRFEPGLRPNCNQAADLDTNLTIDPGSDFEESVSL